jgi:hypothetical protein
MKIGLTKIQHFAITFVIAISLLGLVYTGAVAQELQTGSQSAYDTPSGIMNAITAPTYANWYFEVQADSEVLEETVEKLFSEGVPPGIITRVAKSALQAGNDPVKLLLELQQQMEDGEIPWGLAANAIAGEEKHKNNNQEHNRSNQPSPEPELELEGQELPQVQAENAVTSEEKNKKQDEEQNPSSQAESASGKGKNKSNNENNQENKGKGKK